MLPGMGTSSGPRQGRPSRLVERGARRSPGRVALAWVAALLLVAAAPARGDDGPDGRFDRSSSDHFVLYQDVGIGHRTGWRGSRQFEREVLTTLERAHDGLRDLLGIAPRSRITVVVYAPDVFDAQFAGVAAFPAAGFYQGVIRVRGGVRLTPEVDRVLRHEYVHAALASAAPSLVLPALVNEGLAEWFARRSLGLPPFDGWEVGVLAESQRRGALPGLGALLAPSFVRLDPSAAALAYLQSRAFVAHLVHRHGERSLLEFWRVLVRSRSFERALDRAYGQDLAQIEREMRASLEG